LSDIRQIAKLDNNSHSRSHVHFTCKNYDLHRNNNLDDKPHHC